MVSRKRDRGRPVPRWILDIEETLDMEVLEMKKLSIQAVIREMQKTDHMMNITNINYIILVFIKMSQKFTPCL